MTYGMLGFFAGKVGDTSVNISGLGDMDKRQCKAMCGGWEHQELVQNFFLERKTLIVKKWILMKKRCKMSMMS